MIAAAEDRAASPDRVAHVVTYVSADGAFGGPVAVATAQASELARRGVPVDLIAAWDGVAQPAVAPGVRLVLHRARHIGAALAGVFSLRLLAGLIGARRKYRVVHVHVTRDLVCLPVLLLLRRHPNVVLQPHGQIRPDRRPAARLADHLIVRPALRRARAVLVLTEKEQEAIQQVGGSDIALRRIDNGVPEQDSARTERTGTPVVLFLARLHARKQVMVFAEAALRSRRLALPAVYDVVGPDGGDLTRLRDFIREHALHDVLRYRGAVSQEEAQASLAAAHVLVLPSVQEVYPMTVLQAMAVGTPVVLSEDCGLSDRLRAERSALIVPPRVDDVLAAVAGLVTDESARSQLAARGLADVRRRFSIERVVDGLVQTYGFAAPRSPSS